VGFAATQRGPFSGGLCFSRFASALKVRHAQHSELGQ
jgi:hypothetical protein